VNICKSHSGRCGLYEDYPLPSRPAVCPGHRGPHGARVGGFDNKAIHLGQMKT
jgi:hypothetical protein